MVGPEDLRAKSDTSCRHSGPWMPDVVLDFDWTISDSFLYNKMLKHLLMATLTSLLLDL